MSRPPAGPRSALLVDHAPFGHWHTRTPDQVRGRLFIAGLGCDGPLAPWVLDGAMNGTSFEAYVEHELAPALKPGQVVIANNLSSHKSPRAFACHAPHPGPAPRSAGPGGDAVSDTRPSRPSPARARQAPVAVLGAAQA